MLNIDIMILQAMKDKQDGKVRTYRAIKSEIQAFKTAKNAGEYNEAAEIKILNKMIKQREDSFKQYIEAGRPELAAVENIELMYLQELVPEAPTEEDIEGWLEFNNYHTISKKEMGSVISAVKTEFPAADGKMVARIVKELVV